MKAMIFAAGLGTRLAPLTDHCPKALIEVGGVPMLERVIRRLRDAGVGEIVVNIHHHAVKIREFLDSRPDLAEGVSLSDESELLLDTGGGVVKAAPLLRGDEPVMLYNADILTDFPIAEMLDRHLSTGADATLLVSPTRPSSRGLLFDTEGRMCGWINRKTGEVKAPAELPAAVTPMSFGGIHIISPSLLGDLERYGKEVFSMTPFYTDSCAANRYMAYIPTEDYTWIDIGRPETLAKAQLYSRKLSEK
ncbi:MAG: nucleotidyltransferase family protein [Duncaniella sp.]|nr:nucleotidyltransferase family protein [Duncaniella sp.]